MGTTTSDRGWTDGAPALSSKETDTVVQAALGDDLAAETAKWRRRASEARFRRAKDAIRLVAMSLAEDGESADLIREAMTDYAVAAADQAAKYIAEYDAKEEERIAIDREDLDDAAEDRENAGGYRR